MPIFIGSQRFKSFQSLAKSYDGFSIPCYEIKTGPSLSELKPLSAKEYPVLSINVSQSVGSASTAQVTFACQFIADKDKGDFKTNIFSKLVPEQLIEISLGYSSPSKQMEPVYIGVMGTVHTEFSPSGITASVTCYDVRMLLFNNVHYRSFKQKKRIEEVVNEILSPYKKYCKIKVSGNKYDKAIDPAKAHEWKQDYVDDYRYVMYLASLSNSIFFVNGNTLCFVENHADATDVNVALGWGSGLMKFAVDIDVSYQIGSVKIEYYDYANTKQEIEYDGSDLKGDGQLASKVTYVAAMKKIEAMEVLAKNNDQATLVGKSKFLQNAMRYVTGRGSTVGIPDIKAGDAIMINGVGNKLSGRYLLTQVTHQFDAGGFLTSFVCQRPKT